MEDVEAFRAEVRAWLSRRYELMPPDVDDERLDIIARTPDGHETVVAQARQFQREDVRGGLRSG